MGLPDNVKVAIAGLVVVATAIAGAIIAGPAPGLDFAAPGRISDPVADAGRAGGRPVFARSGEVADPRTIEFTLGARPEIGIVALGGRLGPLEDADWPVHRFPGVIVD